MIRKHCIVSSRSLYDINSYSMVSMTKSLQWRPTRRLCTVSTDLSSHKKTNGNGCPLNREVQTFRGFLYFLQSC